MSVLSFLLLEASIIILFLLWRWVEKENPGFCKDCKFSNFDAGYYECRRYPPGYRREVGIHKRFAFPEMDAKEWCWEFKKGIGGFVLPFKKIWKQA